MKRCKSCLTKAHSEYGQCPVCGILQETGRKALSPDEKKVRFHARCILGAAALHLLGAGICLYILLVINPAAAAKGELVFAPPIIATLTTLNLLLAFGLSRYAFWAYRVATVYYFLLGIVNVVSVQLPGILLVLILLYCVGNGTAKAIFERRTQILSP